MALWPPRTARLLRPSIDGPEPLTRCMRNSILHCMQTSMSNGQPTPGLLIGERWASGEGEHLLKVCAPFGGQLIGTTRQFTPAPGAQKVAEGAGRRRAA